MNWKLRPEPEAGIVRELEQQLGTDAGSFPRPLAILLAQRGIQSLDSAKTFLSPSLQQLHDPFLMQGMDIACRRILQALKTHEPILIYGDYDVDGTTSVSLLQLFFEDLGHRFETYIPNRFIEGYGISFEGIQYAQENHISLIIALDCGTKAVDKVRFANAQGIDVIVVDHHALGSSIPAVVAMLNPLQPTCGYPDKSLSACGLTLKLCQGIYKTLADEGLAPDLPAGYDPFEQYSDLVALSIACDIVPLHGENRVMLHHGLEKIRRNPLPGIAALKSLNQDGREWTVSDLVFYMGPRINSAGRLKNATTAVALLTGKAPDLTVIAQSLDAFNEERKTVESSITRHALDLIGQEEHQDQRHTTVLFHEDWNKGVIGIVASRLIEHYHRPTILLTRSGDYLVGSGRSVPGFDLYEAIERCGDHLVQFGGHKYAAGLTMKEEAYPQFRQAFEDWVKDALQADSRQPELHVDTHLDFRQLDVRFMRLLKRLSPFGPTNPEPNFLTSGVRVKEATILKTDHVRFVLEHDGITIEAIGFFLASQWNQLNQLSLDIVYQPDIKTWNGKTYVQLRIKDFRAAQ